MVAELLRLKTRLLLNGFRRPGARIFGSVVLLLLAVAALLLAVVVARRVTEFDGAIVGRVLTLGGVEVSLGALMIPVMFARAPLLEPRAFVGYRIRSAPLAGALLLLTVLGPAILFVVPAALPTLAWRPVPAALSVAAAAVPLLFLQLLLLVRIGVAIGAALTPHPQARAWIRLVCTLTLLGGLATVVALVLPRVVLLAPDRSLSALGIVVHVLAPVHAAGIADVLAGSPLASLWGAPGLAASGEGDPRSAIWIGVIVTVGLLLVWWATVAGALRPTRRQRLARAEREPGWFRRMPASPAGAVAARSFIYWARDPRYRVVFGILPVLPVLTALAFFVGGVPVSIAAFVPLALMVLVLAWSTIHNDIAYDSTAIWAHITAQTRGVHDRLGRIWPVLLSGVVLIAIGTPITVWVQGDPDSLPAVLGINIALLLGGIGVGSALAPRYPYPAPRPGDGAFTFPQASGGSGGGAQAASFLLTILVAVPPIAATTLWLLGFSGPFPLIALGTGVLSGGLAFWLGIRGGASTFDRRGPELLAFTMQN